MSTHKTEAQEQEEVVAYVRIKYPNILMTTTGAGMRNDARVSAQMNRRGYTKGMPDLLIFEPRGGFLGIVIEMKAVGGTVRPDQKKVLAAFSQRGWKAVICRGAQQGKDAIDDFMKLEAEETKN